MAYVADLVDLANAKLPDRHLQIGPSHFMRADLDREKLELIWEHSVLPYIADQFYDEPDRLEEFDLTRLELEIGGPAPQTVTDIGRPTTREPTSEARLKTKRRARSTQRVAALRG